MTLYYYDIWDGDKGIIFAENGNAAIEQFRNAYKDIPIAGVDVDEFDSGIAQIDTVTDNFNGVHVIEEY